MAEEHSLRQLASLTRRLQEALLDVLAAGRGPWPALGAQFAERTGYRTTEQFAEAAAQAVTCGMYAVATGPERLPPAARTWLLAQADPLLAHLLRPCLFGPGKSPAADAVETAAADIAGYLADRPGQMGGAPRDADRHVHHGWIYFFEEFLGQYCAQTRRRQGVYYTPPELAAYVVRDIDQMLRRVGTPGRLGRLLDVARYPAGNRRRAHVHDRSPRCGVCAPLDPAMGTGVFLLAAFDHIRHAWAANHATHTADAWSEFVTSIVLPRLCGQELMLPAVVLAHLLMTAQLVESGFNFQRPGKLQLHLGNTLSQPRIGETGLVDAVHPYTVVLGNPPFSGVSDNNDPWVRQLLHGRAPGTPSEVANYFQVDGQPLSGKKALVGGRLRQVPASGSLADRIGRHGRHWICDQSRFPRQRHFSRHATTAAPHVFPHPRRRLAWQFANRRTVAAR